MTTMTIESSAFSFSSALEPSRARRWTGRIVSGLLVAFLAFDALAKVFYVPAVAEASAAMGISKGAIIAIGVVLLLSTVLYVVPRTAAIGAILLTGYLGGAIATHVVLGTGAFSIGFALAFGILAWVGLLARDARTVAALRALVSRE